MATDRDTLKFEKEGSDDVKDLYVDFGFKTTSVPLFVPLETKEPPSRDWNDEDGEDVLFPETLSLKAYDVDVNIVYKGALGTFQSKLEAFYRYFTTNGTEINVFSPYSQTGCAGARFKGFSNIILSSDTENGDVATLSVGFRVTKPGQSYIIR